MLKQPLGRFCYSEVMKQVYIIDNGSFYTEQLTTLLPGHNINVYNFDEINPLDITPNSLIILSGGHKLRVQWHDREYSTEIQLIKKYTGPIIGVCLGAQLIAHVYGEHLHVLEEYRKGTVTIHAMNTSIPLFKGIKELRVYENHHLSIQQLHLPLVGLAQSDDGIEVFRHQIKPVYGIQFHPEVLTGNDGLQLFKAILEDVEAER